MIEDLFVQARKAYLQSTGGCPNDAARVVDEWIAFVDSGSWAAGSAARPSDATPWHIRFREWTANIPRARPANEQLARLPPTSNHTNEPVVKREDTPDDASVVEVGSTRPDKSTSKRKRNQSESPEAPRSRSRPSKRRENKPHNSDEATCHQLQLSEPPSGPAQGRHTGRLALALSAARDSSPAIQHHDPPSSPQQDFASRMSTKARLVKCEEKSAEHINLIHAQDFRLVKQEELVAKHTTDIMELDSRPKSVEAGQPPNQELASAVQTGNQQGHHHDQAIE